MLLSLKQIGKKEKAKHEGLALVDDIGLEPVA